MSFELRGVCALLQVFDMPASLAFYRDVLGFSIIGSAPPRERGDDFGWVWTVLKTFAVSFLVIWFRVAYPRLREDQLQKLAWTGLVPLVLLQLAITTVGVQLQ